MRKTIIYLLCLLALQSSAQTIGIRGGLSLATFTAEMRQYTSPNPTPPTKGETGFKTGFLFGTYADLALTKNLFLRPGVEMVLKGARETGTYMVNGTMYRYSSTRNYPVFDFPLNLVYKKPTNGEQRVLFGGGMVPGLVIEGGLKKFDLGLNAMAGYEFPIGLTFNLNYNHGLLDLGQPYSDVVSLRNRSIGIAVGYFF